MNTPSSKSQGSTLFVTVGLILVLFLLAWGAFDFSFFTGRNSHRIQTRQQALYVADSAMEMLFAQFKDAFTQYTQYGGSFNDMCPSRTFLKNYLSGTNPLRIPTGAAFPELAAYFSSVTNFPSSRLDQAPTQVLLTYAIDPLDIRGFVASGDFPDCVPCKGEDNFKEGDAYRYLATVDVLLPAPGGTTVGAHLSRIFEYQQQNMLNYAIFANSFLEINPGPNMTITGDVHTNSILFVGAGNGKITFTGKVEGISMGKTSATDSNKYSGISVGPMTDSGSTANNPTATSPQNKGATGMTPDGIGWSNRNPNAKAITPLDISTSSLYPDASQNVVDAWGKAVPTDTNPNNDSYHEIVELPVFPLTTNPDPFSPGDTRTSASQPFDSAHLKTLRLSNIADYIVTIDNATNDVRQPATTFTITDSSGNTYGASTDVYKAFVNGNFTTSGGKMVTSKVLTTGNTIQDTRESDSNGNATMQITNVDVGALKAAVDAGAIPASSDSGLGIVINDNRPTKAYTPAVTHNVYTTSTNSKGKVTVTGTTVVVDSPSVPKTEPAIRLTNGYVLPSGGLTIVSQNPVYVQGDYNTGGSASNQPVSNSRTGTWADPTKPDPTTVVNANGLITYTDPVTNKTDTYYWQPAAIVADAINVLSNGWQDSKSGTQPTATATTVNAAFMAGNVSTTDSAYSGGVENYPRFLENWTNVRFNYVGSMVILFQSQQANGVWRNSGVYSAPIRNWAYDINFKKYGVPLLSSGGSGQGGVASGGSRKVAAGGGAKTYTRKQWVSRTVQ